MIVQQIEKGHLKSCENWQQSHRQVVMLNVMAESEEELKSLLMNVKKESEKAGLKLNI